MSTGNFHKLRPATDYAGRTERKCKECGQEKPLDEFAITTEFKDVRTPYRANTCRDCSAKPQRRPTSSSAGASSTATTIPLYLAVASSPALALACTWWHSRIGSQRC